MEVSIVIPNFNGSHLLKKNLPSIIEAAQYYHKEFHTTVEIIVGDDCSQDASEEFLSSFAKNYPHKHVEFHFYRNENNLGFSSNVDRGVRKAKGEVVVLLNTDVAPEKDFLIPLLSHFTDTSVFAVGCLDKSIEGGTVVERGRGIGSWKRGFLMHSAGQLDLTHTLWVSGGSGAFRKALWEKLGGMLEVYNPFYWEDIDLSYRAQKAGYTALFEPKAVVTHEHEEGVIRKTRTPFEIRTIAYRNQFFFVWLNVTDPMLWFSHILWLPYHLLKTLLAGDTAFLLGFFQAFLNSRKIIQLASRVHKQFVRHDREVVAQFSK